MNQARNTNYSSLQFVSDCYPLGCKYTAKKEEGKKAKLPVPMFTYIERNNKGKSNYSRLTITVYEEKYY